ncbi:hypothetical protein SAMN05421753_10117 [Planctomicrobium piriforme]|uniref:Carbon storage regulator, CsrA n=1 Tax=Planctomicrobium piriforme TaxID=1576369 RepID=A0A1I3AQZ4_9PLAN|nr:hypothetical protein SAMN05421753_10117 [Planctomicrobium piriforme]
MVVADRTADELIVLQRRICLRIDTRGDRLLIAIDAPRHRTPGEKEAGSSEPSAATTATPLTPGLSPYPK